MWMMILAIETSCDETAVALYSAERGVVASEIFSQIPLHRAYGGVVPEVASRSHLEVIEPLIRSTLAAGGIQLAEVTAFAATSGPGLASSLLVGSSVAKGLAVGMRKPYLAINHMEGHLLSPFIGKAGGVQPNIALVVSGGHTLLVAVSGVGRYELLGKTVDDAAGEAFDKVAKMLGLPYPGGPEIDRVARDGDRKRFDFPRSMLRSGEYQFSFSGLKTAVRYLLPKLVPEDLADVCASFQEAVVDVLVGKTLAALREKQAVRVTLSGGVAGNARLRQRMAEACAKAGAELLVAEGKYCTDNAAMIAQVAQLRYERGLFSGIDEEIAPNLSLDWLQKTAVPGEV